MMQEEKMKFISSPLRSDLMPLFRKAAMIREPLDKAAVRDLCRRMTGLSEIKLMNVAHSLADMPTPAGYLHVRIFDAADEHEITSSYSTDGKPLPPHGIAALIMINERFLAGRWIATEPLYDQYFSAPGILDLLVRFEPRETPLGFHDIA